MTAAAILALLGTLVLGAVVGLLYLQRVRRPRLVTAHLVAAILALAAVLLAVATAPGERMGGPHPVLPVALTAAALGLGYGAFRLRWGVRRGHDMALVAHVALGIAAFFVFLAWRKTL